MLADASLGKLCKWLRLTGFDVAWDPTSPDPARLRRLSGNDRRWVLTRSHRVFKALEADRCLLVQPDTALEQIRQVIHHFGIARGDLRPLSRCTRCNQLISKASKQSIAGQIPDYVWQSHTHFMRCSRCRRIYWRGSHAMRIHSIVDLWFQSS